MIEIKNIQGSTKLQVVAGEQSVRKFQLMSEDYLLLVFETAEPVKFNIGDYVEYEGVKFHLNDISYPTYNTATSGYSYQLRFEAYYYLWKNHILFYDRQDKREAGWSLTRSPEAHLSVVVSNLNSLGFTFNSKPFKAVVGSEVDSVPKLVQYDSTNIIDGLTKIAEAWECEWWVVEDTIYIGKLEYGEPVKLEIGVDANTMSRSRSQDLYATRLYAFGSTRNIPADYRQGSSGDVVGGVTNNRLMLPEGVPYVDVIDGLSQEEIIEAVVVFDNIYPRRIGSITEVSEKEVTEETDDGEQIAYKVYRFKDSGFIFSESYVIPGQTLKIQFQTGTLAGLEFDVIFNPDDLSEDDPNAQVFQIERNENYGQPLPSFPLVPEVGNKYVLSGFDTQFVSDTLLPLAEEELLQSTLDLKADIVSDPSTYVCELNSFIASGYEPNTDIFNPDKAINLLPGNKVLLINPAYFDNGRETRVIGYEKKLDKPYDKPKYTVGESASYSRLNALQKQIDNIKIGESIYVNQGSGGGSFGVYIIKKDDTIAASDENVFSALRTLQEIFKAQQDISKKYLRKDIDDVASGNILFKKKIGSYEYVDGWNGFGWQILDGSAQFDGGKFRDNALFKKRAGSHTFVSGFPNGIGWDIAPYKRVNSAGVEETKYRLEIDDINVRGKLRAFEFVISQLRGENDNVIFAGMMKVEYYDEATGRLYLDTDKGVLYNPFRSGDILMVQHYGGQPSAENNYNLMKSYELRVDEVGIGNISDGENRLDWITFVNFVGDKKDIAQGDVLTRVDSYSDSTRKGIVRVQTIDEIGAPYIDVVYGMKTDPDNATKARFGNLSGIRTKSGIDLTGVWGIYGNGAYFENSTYILDTGNTIEQEFSIMNGKFESSIEGIRNDISLEPGNILRNSSFSQNTDYWVTENSISFWGSDSDFIYAGANASFLSEKAGVSDIYQDGNRNVLRIKNSYILQRNDIIDIPSHDVIALEYDYSFSLHYRVLQAGTLKVGFENTSLYTTIALEPSASYRKLFKAGKWNEQGDFRIEFDGEILIYGVSLFTDNFADAIIRLETRIEQTEEAIKLAATKEYVDEETGKVYTKYDAELSVMSQEITQRVTREDFDSETGALKSSLESKINIEAGRITSAVEDIDYINNRIDTAGWITTSQGNTLYAKKSLENGNEIISYINQTATTTTIKANRINLSGAVTYSDLDSSLQDKVDAAGGEALDKAVEAYNKAVSAYNRADSAYDLADSADTTASNAYSRATTAINNAAAALNAANEAQTSVDNLPGWSKEKDIIAALEDATVIVNGYIATSMIDVENLYAKKLAATEGTIAGFRISSNMLENTNFGSKIRISDSSNNKYINIGGTGTNCISISSYGSGNVGLYVLSNAGSRYAIEAYGAMVLGQRTGESWNAPGVLCCYSITASGSHSRIWGNGASITAVTDSGNGQYIVRHDVGHSNFSVLGIINGTNYIGNMRLNSLGSTLFTVEWRNQNGDTIRPNFHLFLIGRNTW